MRQYLKADMNKTEKIKGLIGLDLDGTALDTKKHLSEPVRREIERAIAAGYLVVPVTGRTLRGIPSELMTIPGIRYAVTSNGAELFQINDFIGGSWENLFRVPLSYDQTGQVLQAIMPYHALPDCFIDGRGNLAAEHLPLLKAYGLPEGILRYIFETRNFQDDLPAYIREHSEDITKVTIYFNMNADGLHEKELAREALSPIPDILTVSGGRHNLEVSHISSGKGRGLLRLAELLGVDPFRTMGCGDEENDLDLIRRTAFGVAMGNALPHVKAEADYVAPSNDEDGVAAAIKEFLSADADSNCATVSQD